jgi:hypothetical protein
MLPGMIARRIAHRGVLRGAIAALLLLLCAAMAAQEEGLLRASLADLPGLSGLSGSADRPGYGPFEELVKAIDEAYRGGRIVMDVYPFARSVNNVLVGAADFHVPSIRNPEVDQGELPYGTVSVPMGKVAFVIYSNSAKILTRSALKSTIEAGGPLQYDIDVAGGIQDQFPFRVSTTNDIERSLKKVSAGRLDALIWAQEDTDLALRALRLANIHREFWMDFDDVIIVPKGSKGERLDRLLSAALTRLSEEGRLEKLHDAIHKPYWDWQP